MNWLTRIGVPADSVLPGGEMFYLKRKPKKAKEKAPKERRPSVASLIRKLDTVFSEYVRLRDSRPYGYKAFRCISCGQIKPYEQADAGHFIGRTHMATRFDELNVNAECRFDNRFNSSHMIYYQKNLEKKIGKERLDLLIAKGRQTKKWSAFELDLLIKYYSERVKEMKRERDGAKM